MPDVLRPLPIISKPGVRRDGTLLQSDHYSDALWCRWYMGLPKKIGGYEQLTNRLPEKVYGMNVDELGNSSYVHVGSSSRYSQFVISDAGVIPTVINRTPASLVTDDNNVWQADVMYDSISGSASIITVATPTLDNVYGETDAQIFIGPLTDSTPLVNLTGSSESLVSGGVVVLHPYLVVYGNDGLLRWSVPNEPQDLTGTGSSGANGARIAEDKILKGLPLRGGPGNSPAGMFWSVRSLIRMSFVGGTSVFDFDTLSHNISLMSPSAVVEYDGVYYWAGIDRFYVYDGVVRELPNIMNFNWFFDGINRTWRGKVFAFAVPRWGEIWWCYPRDDATECTHAVIFNVREQTWYDTELPQGGRSSAGYSQIYASPLLTGVDEDDTTTGYILWRNEVGVDQVIGSQSLAIESYFVTSPYFPAEGGTDVDLYVERIEPDFVQAGTLRAYLLMQPNARAPVVETDSRTITEQVPDTGVAKEEQAIYFRDGRRQVRFKFESNEAGGDYLMGQCMAYVKDAPPRLNT